MTVKKLSQIAVSPTAPLATDTVVGVGGGNTDLQYPVNLLAQAIPLPANQAPFGTFTGNTLNLYVSPSGSDSNPGTPGSPLFTLQRALNIISQYDFLGTLSWFIVLADGTYTDGHIDIGFVKNAGQGGTIEGNSSTPGNVIFNGNGTYNFGGIAQDGNASMTVLIDGLTMQLGAFANAFVVSGAALIQYGNINIDFGPSGVFGTFTFAEGGSVQQFGGNTVNIAGAAFRSMADVAFACNFQMASINLNFPASITVSDFFNPGNAAAIAFGNSTVMNGGGVTGFSLNAFANANIKGILPASIPGTSGVRNVDNTIVFGFSGQSVFTKAGIPTNTDIGAGLYAIYKDTSGGGVYVAYNDAGTIKKVQLV